MNVITIPGEKITYVAPNWNDLHTFCYDVCTKISLSDIHIDRLITLAKGGWSMSLPIVDFLQLPAVASIGVRFYSGIGTRFDQPEIYQDLPVPVKGEHVLLFDDVVDTGESMKFVKKHLEDIGVASVTTASLFYKPRSIYKPDYYGQETTSWIVFPYDAFEFMILKGKEWGEKGIDQEVMKQRFLSLSIQEVWIDHYFSQHKK